MVKPASPAASMHAQAVFISPALPMPRIRPTRLIVRAVSKKVADIRHYPAGTDKAGARKIRSDLKRKARAVAAERRKTPQGFGNRTGVGMHSYGSEHRTTAERNARAKLVGGKPGTSEALFKYCQILSGGECDMLINRLRALWLERLEHEESGRPVRLNKDLRFLYNLLVSEIKLCDEMYYADDPKPRISDQEYDELILHLIEIERCFPEVISQHSPANTVGHGASARATKLALENEVSDESVSARASYVATVPTSTKLFPQYKHRALMFSLDNAYDHSDLISFTNRASIACSQITAELKIDGVALSLEYRNRNLYLASTRGTGRIGDDITVNVKEALIGRGVVATIPDPEAPDFLLIRGEVFITKDDFQDINTTLEKPLSNPRNAAAGALKQKDPAQSKARRIRFIAYECLQGITDEKQQQDTVITAVAPETKNTWSTHSETLSKLAAWGFGEMPRYQTCATISEFEVFANQTEAERSTLPMEVDGIVLKFEDSRRREAAGHTARAPKGAIAYKFAAQSKTTKLIDVVMQVSRSGLITPVAILEPVRIGGSLLSRATLHNFDEVKRLGVALGDTIRVERGGDVIPKVISVEKRCDRPDREEIKPPTACPSCGSELRDEKAARTKATLIGCTNVVSCSSQTLGRLIHFSGRDAMDIRGLGNKTAQKLIDSGVVVVLADIFRLTLDDVFSLDGFAGKSASQLYENVREASTSRSLERLMFGLGFPGVGRAGARALALKMGSLGTLLDIAEDENGLQRLMGISNFAEKTAECLLTHIKKERTITELRAMTTLVIPSEITDETERDTSSGNIVADILDRNFVFTGRFIKVNRVECMKWIKQSGGFVKSTVTNKTDYVICGLDPGQKLYKAQRAKVHVLPEEEFFSFFEIAPGVRQKLSFERKDKSD